MTTLPGRFVGRLADRTVVAARRAATATGVQQVRELGQAVDRLALSVGENAGLERGLERRVGEIERSLLTLLELRAQRGSEGSRTAHAPSSR